MPNWRTIWPKPQTGLLMRACRKRKLIAARRRSGNYTNKRNELGSMERCYVAGSIASGRGVRNQTTKAQSRIYCGRRALACAGDWRKCRYFPAGKFDPVETAAVKNPEQLAIVDWNKDSARAGSWSTRSANFTYTQWDLLRAQHEAFSDMIAWAASQFDLTSGGEPRFAQGLYVSGSLFPVLGVGAEVGHTLSASDDNTTCNAVAVISDAFWRREFGGDPHVLGRRLTLNGYPVSVIGVTPPSFFGVEVGHRYDVAIPPCADRLMADDHKGRIPGRLTGGSRSWGA